MEFKGKLVKKPILTTGVTKAGKNWASCEFIVEEQTQYPQKGKFKYFAQDDKTKFVKSFAEKAKAGDKLDISFNIKCNDYQGKEYIELSVWSVKFADQKAKEPFIEVKQEDDLDLPF